MKTLKNILFNFLLKYTLWTTVELSYIFINISYFNQIVRARKYFKLSILIISHRGHLMPRKVNYFLSQKSDSNGRASSRSFDLILPKPPAFKTWLKELAPVEHFLPYSTPAPLFSNKRQLSTFPH